MNLTVATAQYPITKFKNFEDWERHIERWVAEAAKKEAQLLLFPEYGAMELVSIFPEEIQADVKRQVVEFQSLRESICAIFSGLAKKYNVVIVAPSIPVLEEGNLLNRAHVFSSKGLVGHQDKFFMTRWEDEVWGIKSAPKVLTLFEASWGSFGVQICYDVEFPLGASLLSSAGASIILAPSCTETARGATRVHIGARARALEAQAYSVVSQTVGEAPWSRILDKNYGYNAFYCAPVLDMPEEGILNKKAPQAEGWLIHTLDLSHITDVRNKGRVLNFKDNQRFYSDFPDEEVVIVRKQV